MEIIKSVPTNIQLSEDLSHQIPRSTGCLTPPWTPSRAVEVNSYSSMGFNLHRGRWQVPLLFTHWQCSWEVPTCSWHSLPWFVDLTFQDPMQYCSLEHRTLLLSPVTSTTGCCFCFGSVPSSFLELFFYWSPVAYWSPTNMGSSFLSVLSFCLFQ